MKKYHNFFKPGTKTPYTQEAPLHQHVKDATIYLSDGFRSFIFYVGYLEEVQGTYEVAMLTAMNTLLTLKQSFSGGDYESRKLRKINGTIYRDTRKCMISLLNDFIITAMMPRANKEFYDNINELRLSIDYILDVISTPKAIEEEQVDIAA